MMRKSFMASGGCFIGDTETALDTSERRFVGSVFDRGPNGVVVTAEIAGEIVLGQSVGSESRLDASRSIGLRF